MAHESPKACLISNNGHRLPSYSTQACAPDVGNKAMSSLYHGFAEKMRNYAYGWRASFYFRWYGFSFLISPMWHHIIHCTERFLQNKHWVAAKTNIGAIVLDSW